jgi:hypothetical protein
MKTLKKMDIVIIFTLICLSFTPNIIHFKLANKNYNLEYIVIKVSKNTYKEIPLSEDDEFEIQTENGSNTVLIENNTIKITSATCTDGLCMKQGAISKVGQSIICLPNQVIIEIKGEESEDFLLSH